MTERLRSLWRGDGVLAVLFVLLLLAYLLSATQLGGGLMSDVVGPRTYPVLLSVLGLGLCLLFFAQKFVARSTESEDDTAEPMTLAGEMPHLVPLAVTLVYALLLTTLGYVLATFLYATAMLKLLGQRTWWGSAVFGAALAAASFVLFAIVFEVRLPPGDLLPAPY